MGSDGIPRLTDYPLVSFSESSAHPPVTSNESASAPPPSMPIARLPASPARVSSISGSDVSSSSGPAFALITTPPSTKPAVTTRPPVKSTPRSRTSRTRSRRIFFSTRYEREKRAQKRRLWSIEDIVGERARDNRVLVRWKGFPPTRPTWEPRDAIPLTEFSPLIRSTYTWSIRGPDWITPIPKPLVDKIEQEFLRWVEALPCRYRIVDLTNDVDGRIHRLHLRMVGNTVIVCLGESRLTRSRYPALD